MPSWAHTNDFWLHLGQAIHNFGSHNIALALSNTAPGSESSNPLADTNGLLSNVTQISYANYTDTLTIARRLQGTSWALSAGVATFDAANFVITASGGAIATFQYHWIFNDSDAGDRLIGVYDHGSPIALADGQSYNVNFHANGLFYLQETP